MSKRTIFLFAAAMAIAAACVLAGCDHDHGTVSDSKDDTTGTGGDNTTGGGEGGKRNPFSDNNAGSFMFSNQNGQ